LGFLPRGGPERKSLWEEAGSLRATIAFYESPKRLAATLEELSQLWGNRRACVARELTKLHEEWARGTLAQLAARYASKEVLGEVVVLVEGRQEEGRWSQEEVRAALALGLERGQPLKELATDIARRAGWVSKDVYRIGVSIKQS
jgi:16S rRNA (cytidine1402-2'-O)-methyltransferase